jgi:hypothetical protein
MLRLRLAVLHHQYYLQGGVYYSKKGNLFIHLRYFLDLIEEALKADNRDSGSTERQLVHVFFLDSYGPCIVQRWDPGNSQL